MATTTAATAAATKKNDAVPVEATVNEADAAALMERLRHQFGDVDLRPLTDATAATADDDDVESEESSLAEPSPEELRAWQEEQFRRGAEKTRTRRALETATRSNDDDDDDGWEVVTGPPRLEGGRSSFFPKGSDDPLLRRLYDETGNGDDDDDDDDVLGGPWRRLFSSAEGGDGLSFGALRRALEGYDGPTVTLVGARANPARATERDDPALLAEDDVALGYYAAAPWSVGNDRDGSSSSTAAANDVDRSFLFALDRRRGTARCVRTRRRRRRRDGATGRLRPPCANGGLVVGDHRLVLTETLWDCCALPHDDVFEPSSLLPFGPLTNHYFDADPIEVWGVGGARRIERALERRTTLREHDEARRRRDLAVDRRGFLDHFRSATTR